MVGGSSIKLDNLDGNKCLRFHFDGYLEAGEAQRLISEWKRIFTDDPDRKFIVVWNCLKMNGYESDARKLWTDALKGMKPQIQEIRIITESSAIKMGASIMAMVTQTKLRVFSSEDQAFSKRP